MAEVNPKAKGFSTLIIVILFVLLIGGGFGLWMFLKPKSSEGTTNESTNTEDDSLTGRNDVSDQNTGLTAEQIANLFGNQDNSFGNTQNNNSGTGDVENTNPPPPPLYVKSNKAKELIAAKAERLQSKGQVMDIIRAKYDIGKSLIAFGQDAQRAIDSLMSKVAGVDLSTNPTKRYLTYPIYGTHESRGAQARQQLQNLINRDAHGFSLANGRHGDKPWWIPVLQINLLIGTDKADTWSADKIWWYQASREDIDWFKAMNGLWKNDRELLEPSSGTPWYYAGNMRTFVRRWIEAIDRLDLVTEWEAIRTLTAPVAQGGDGWVFTYIDPNTGEDQTNQYDPQDSTTNDNVDAILN